MEAADLAAVEAEQVRLTLDREVEILERMLADAVKSGQLKDIHSDQLERVQNAQLLPGTVVRSWSVRTSRYRRRAGCVSLTDERG